MIIRLVPPALRLSAWAALTVCLEGVLASPPFSTPGGAAWMPWAQALALLAVVVFVAYVKGPAWLEYLLPFGPLGRRNRVKPALNVDDRHKRYARTIIKGWQQALVRSGLAEEVGSDRRGRPTYELPALVALTSEPLGLRVTLGPTSLVSRQDIEAKAERLATALGAREMRLVPGDLQQVHLLLIDSDPSAGTRTAAFLEDPS